MGPHQYEIMYVPLYLGEQLLHFIHTAMDISSDDDSLVPNVVRAQVLMALEGVPVRGFTEWGSLEKKIL